MLARVEKDNHVPGILGDAGDGRRWYVLRTEPNRERMAAAHLIGRRFKAYVPTFQRITNYAVMTMFGVSQRKRLGLAPIFRGYLFIKIGFDVDGDRLRHIHAAPGIHRFMAIDGQYVVISEADMEKIQFIEQMLGVPKASVAEKYGYEPGEEIRIVAGPFLGFNATISEILKLDDEERITLLFSIFGRDTTTTVPVSYIQKL